MSTEISKVEPAGKVMPVEVGATLFNPSVHDDLFALSARLQRLTRPLHDQPGVVVSLRSALYHDPEHVEETAPLRDAPGHFNIGEQTLSINIDRVIDFVGGEKFPSVSDLNSPDRFLETHPIMMGVVAHELAHARWTHHQGIPEGYSFMSESERLTPGNIPGVFSAILDEMNRRGTAGGFTRDDLVAGAPRDRAHKAVMRTGHVSQLVDSLDEGRIERLIQDGGPRMVFSKPWRKAARLAAAHLVTRGFASLASGDTNLPDAVVALNVLSIIHGRTLSGSLDMTDDTIIGIVDTCSQAIDDHANPGMEGLARRVKIVEEGGELPSDVVKRIIRRAVFSNDHDDPTTLIQCALDMIDAIQPPPPEPEEPESSNSDSDDNSDDSDESSDDEQESKPQSGKGKGKPEKPEPEGEEPAEPEDGDGEDGDGEPEDGEPEKGDGDGEPEESEGGGSGQPDGEPEEGDGAGSPQPGESGETETPSEFLETLADLVNDFDKQASEVAEAQRVNSERDDSEKGKGKGYGSVLHRNPNAPRVWEQRPPNGKDQVLYHAARSWMERVMSPTVVETQRYGWMPESDSEFDVDSYVYDELAGNVGDERGDWRRREWAVKPAPPMKIAIMLDCSGSMSDHVEAAASVAWALQAAASDIPGSQVCSVAYGDEAGITLEPGRLPPRELAIMNANSGTENWASAVKLVNERLLLDDAILDDLADPSGDSKSNALLIVVSDFYYGGIADDGEYQRVHVARDLARWRDAGFKVVVVGPIDAKTIHAMYDGDETPSPSHQYFGGIMASGLENRGVTKDVVRRAFAGLDSVTGTRPEDMAREFDAL